MAAFFPPLYSKFGSSIKDLLTKKYDYKNQISTKNNVQGGDVNVESTIVLGEGKEKGSSDFSGTVKTTYKNKDFGQFEGEIATKGALAGELKATKLHEGLTVSLKATEKPTGKVGLEYKQDSLATTLSAEVQSGTTLVEGTVVAGVDGFSVGGQGLYNTAKNDLDDYNFGGEYAAPDYTFTVKTAAKAEQVVGSYWHRVPSSRGKLSTQVGGQLAWDLQTNARIFTLGTEHDVDDTTSVKAKIDSNGVVGGVVEHRLANPALKVGLSSQWNGKNKAFSSEKFGVALTFGDF
jgi:voltage-dependent anion channel protein 2